MADQLDSHQKILTLFQTSQCSWCRKFYTNEPFLCPSGKLQSNCASFDRLIEIVGWWSREKESKKYLTRIVNTIRLVEKDGIMAKCRDAKCGALNPNPNPQKPTCWKCGKHTLCCPKHESLTLIYKIEENYWKCSLASHTQKFYEIIESTLTDTPCPKCSTNPLYEEKPALYYDAESFLLKCNKCNRFFTYDKGKLKEVKMKS
ncbi:MAG TPA: hypothetical protein VMW86_04195 [Dehalococcoidales bacterium]|nr:hypothetical protein [Dehalococcoidales bacterium]